MNERKLLMLCLFCSVLGLAILFVGVQYVEAKAIPVGDVNGEYEGTLVAVEGTVYSRYYNGEHIFFTLKDETGKIKIVLFSSEIKRLGIDPEEIRNGMKIRIEGAVKTYKGELEILPERMEIIS